MALSVGDVQVVEGDSGSRLAVFEVHLSQPAAADLTLNYTTRDGSGIAGEDYVATSGTLTFLAGETVKAVSVEVLGDATVEVSESFSLSFTPTAALANGSDGLTGVATILDDDAGGGSLPVLSLSGAEVVEGDGTFSPNMEFVVTLSEVATTDVIVDYQTLAGTADESLDFNQTLLTDRLVIAAGERSGVITITILGGTLPEADESLILELTNVEGAVFAGDAPSLRATGIIQDNDSSGPTLALSVGDVQVVEGDSGSRLAVFEVHLSQPAANTVTVDFTTQSGTATASSDFETTSGTLTFLPGQTVAAVSVAVTGDATVEPSEYFTLVLSAPQGAIFGSGGTGVSATGTILDDDAGVGGEPVISISGSEVVEQDGTFSPNMEFVVTLSAPSSSTVTVDFTTQDGTGTAGSDFTARSGTLTFVAGQTSAVIVVTVLGDTLLEGNETFAIELSNPQNAALAGDATTLSATSTIIDNQGNRSGDVILDPIETIVGDTAVGTFTLTADEAFTTQRLLIGNQATGIGTVTVDGPGSKLTVTEGATEIIVGNLGVGLLTVRNQGEVDPESMIIGAGAGSFGVVEVENASILLSEDPNTA